MHRRLVLAGFAVVFLAACSSGKEASSPATTVLFDTTTTAGLPNTPVVARLLSPERASVQGSGGRGMVVALTFTARDPGVLPAEFRVGGALPAPAPAAKAGHNPAFPSLVVGLSTTSTGLGGPTANLANLFQIVSPSLQLDGTTQVSAIWTNTLVDFGSDVDATLTAYTVSGTAPDVIPVTQANIDVNSNTLEVTFRVSAVTGATVAAPPPASASATTTTIAGPTTTSVKPTTTTAKVVATTTTRGATTTIPATTTTKCLNPLGILCP